MNVFKFAIDKYKSLSVVAKAAFWFTVCSFLQQGISMIVTPFLTRMLTSEEYGIWSVYQTWLTIISIFSTLNLAGGGIINAIIKFKPDQNKLISSLLVLGLATTIAFGSIYLIAEPILKNLINLKKEYVFLMLGEIYFRFVFSLWATQNRYNYKYRSIVLVTFLSSLVSQLASLLMVYYSSNKLEMRIYSSALVPSAVYCVLLIIMLIKGKCFFCFSFWKYMLLFNIPLIPHYLSQIVLNQSDRIMIERICGNSFVAFYSVSYTIGFVITILLNSILSAVSPWLMDKYSQKDHSKIDVVINSLAIFFAVTILLPIALGPELISILGPDEYQQAKWVVIPVASSVYFVFLYNIFSSYLFFLEKKMFIAISSIIAAGANVLLNYLFLPIYGFVAAGYTTLVCYILYSFAVFIFLSIMCKRTNAKRLFNYSFLFVVGIIVVTFSLLCNALYLDDYMRYRFIMVIIVILLTLTPKLLLVFKGVKGGLKNETKL